MTTSVHPYNFLHAFYSTRLSQTLLTLWIALIFIGQWFFAAYVIAQFGEPFIKGDQSGQNFSHMIKGYVAGDSIGNAILYLHILPVILLSLSGILQLIPLIRSKYPDLHRWNGRMFLVIGLSGALTGLWLTWVRDTKFSDFSAMGITINGLLIPIAIGFAWYYARKRNFQAHKRWAVHAFILINGVWSFRLFLMGWFMVNQGPLGNSSTLEGPADIAFTYLCYLLPMLFAEVYFWAIRRQQPASTLALNATLSLAVVLTLIGVVAASMMMWWPRISAAFY